MKFSNFTRPRWLFFDLDDTLLDFSSVSIRCLSLVYRQFPEISSRFASFDDFAATYHTHNSRLWQEFAEGKLSSQFLKTERWRRTLSPESTPKNTPGFCHDIDSRYLSLLAENATPFTGTELMLETVCKQFMTAVLSNGFPDTQYRKLKFSGLRKYIYRLIVSGEIDIQKPDSRIFNYAVDETGASGTPIMIGDNFRTDIIGAMRAGWEAIWFNPSQTMPSDEYDNILLQEGIDKKLLIGVAHNMPELSDIILRQA